MNPADEIARIAAEHRAHARRLLAELDELRRRHAAAEADVRATRRALKPAAEPVDDDEDDYYRPTTWLV